MTLGNVPNPCAFPIPQEVTLDKVPPDVRAQPDWPGDAAYRSAACVAACGAAMHWRQDLMPYECGFSVLSVTVNAMYALALRYTAQLASLIDTGSYV